MLSLIRRHSAVEFLAATEEALAQDEAANNLVYGLALRLAAEPGRFDQTPYLATVQEGSALVCAALMTPPYRLTLFAPAPLQSQAFDLLIGDLRAGAWPVPGVTAAAGAASLFAARWQSLTGEPHHVQVQMRVFELRAVAWPPLPPGHLRPAGPEEAEFAWQWYCDFTSEAVHGDPMPTLPNVRRAIDGGNIYFWDDGGPVSLAARGRRLPHGWSVGPVYTPRALRGRGYATACTAALSQAILDGGAQYCTLFTDLANPTSNAIYQRIGYRPVGDYTEYTFGG
jgi:RimJ/RimL family protein N-acetyltransferase